MQVFNMLQNSGHKSFLMQCRVITMQAMKIALNLYKETKDEIFIERAKELGESSEWYKKEIERLK